MGNHIGLEHICSELENLELVQHIIYLNNNKNKLAEQQQKKNEAIRKIQETLDGVQEDIGDGLYLELMNVMKDHFIVSE